MNPQHLGTICLIAACIRDRSDSFLWAEFLRRYGGKIKHFVRGTLILRSAEVGRYCKILPRAIEDGDLFQNVVLRLVEDDCAVMRAFAGTTDREWLAYLAVTTRSVVCDLLRSQGGPRRSDTANLFAKSCWRTQVNKRDQHIVIEKNILADEVRTICERTIRTQASEHADRNVLIFDLYFFHGLSIRQIAACRGVQLSKTGVAKILHCLRRRVRNVIDENLPQFGKSRSEGDNVVNIDERRRRRERERETEIAGTG